MDVRAYGPEWSDVRVIGDGGEMTPFLFNGQEYLLRNCSAINNVIGAAIPDHAMILHATENRLISEFFFEHYFISGFVHGGRLHCFGGRMTLGTWRAHQLDWCYSDDLVHWSEPVCVHEDPNLIYNTTVVWNGKKFVMGVESNDPRYPIFTLFFYESDDLRRWTPVADAIYGADKYIGGPAMYFMPDGFYYLSYVNEFINRESGKPNYDTRIARSRDLIRWEEGKRPVISPDYGHRPMPERFPDVCDINASDAEYLEVGGRVKCYFAGGNQNGVGDSKMAEFDGTLMELFLRFF